MGILTYLAVYGAGEVENVQQCGVSEVPQSRDTRQGQCLQFAIMWIRKLSKRAPSHIIQYKY